MSIDSLTPDHSRPHERRESTPDHSHPHEPRGSTTPDLAAVEAFTGHVAGHAAAALNSILVTLGDRLGLWRTMAGAGPLTADELAARTGLRPRYLAEWLASQAANGMVDYDAAADTFELTDAAAMVLADESSPFSLIAGFAMLPLLWKRLAGLASSFGGTSDEGWLDWDPEMHAAEERFTRPLHRNLLVDVWLSGVPELIRRLGDGASVADVGCGCGTSTITLAERFPTSRFVGFDFSDHAIAQAKVAAERAGVADRVTFEVADAATFPGDGYDLVLFCDSLHDMGDPVAAARHARTALASGGRLVTLDPAAAGDSLATNLVDPMAAIFYPVSTMICTASALAQDGPHALGALAGEAAMRRVLTDAGFAIVDRVPDTPMNMVLFTTDEGARR